MDSRFQMEFTHNEQTIRRLSQTQYLSFEKKYILLQWLIGLGFLAFAVARQEDTTLFALFALFGCWLLISWKQIPLFRANKIIRQCGGDFPTTRFTFGADGIKVKNDSTSSTVLYADILRLVEDKEYLFLFINKSGAYMLPRQGDVSPLRSFLSQKTGLDWVQVKSIFSLSLKQIKAERKNTRSGRKGL